jgi:hypothetical protein
MTRGPWQLVLLTQSLLPFLIFYNFYRCSRGLHLPLFVRTRQAGMHVGATGAQSKGRRKGAAGKEARTMHEDARKEPQLATSGCPSALFVCVSLTLSVACCFFVCDAAKSGKRCSMFVTRGEGGPTTGRTGTETITGLQGLTTTNRGYRNRVSRADRRGK